MEMKLYAADFGEGGLGMESAVKPRAVTQFLSTVAKTYDGGASNG